MDSHTIRNWYVVSAVSGLRYTVLRMSRVCCGKFSTLAY